MYTYKHCDDALVPKAVAGRAEEECPGGLEQRQEQRDEEDAHLCV